MTVGELIAALSHLDPTLEVLLDIEAADATLVVSQPVDAEVPPE